MGLGTAAPRPVWELERRGPEETLTIEARWAQRASLAAPGASETNRECIREEVRLPSHNKRNYKHKMSAVSSLNHFTSLNYLN